MSEQRETWAPWSDESESYLGTVSQCQESSQLECDDINSDGRFGVMDYRPVRIPPPAEIEANERDAARYQRLLSGQSHLMIVDIDFLDAVNDPHVILDNEIQLEAAMKGGE